MADEIDRGQENGTIQSHGDVQSPDIAKFDDMGLDRRRVTNQHDEDARTSGMLVDSRRVSEWRDVRDAGEVVVENANARTSGI